MLAGFVYFNGLMRSITMSNWNVEHSTLRSEIQDFLIFRKAPLLTFRNTDALAHSTLAVTYTEGFVRF